MSDGEDLAAAIAAAAVAHAGQVDKLGKPYILHPLRVMLAMDTDEERIAAILHDVVEDTDITLAALADNGFSPVVIDALDALTRRSYEDYFDYVARAAENPIGRKVKAADLRDNLDPSRGTPQDANVATRRQRYRCALSMIDTASDTRP